MFPMQNPSFFFISRLLQSHFITRRLEFVQKIKSSCNINSQELGCLPVVMRTTRQERYKKRQSRIREYGPLSYQTGANNKAKGGRIYITRRLNRPDELNSL